MKISKINNKYIVRKMINYKAIRLSFNTKPTKQQIKIAIAERLKKPTESNPRIKTLERAITNYIEIKKNILSPTTLQDYIKTINILRKYNYKLLNANIDTITNELIQDFINSYALEHSPKTCKNILSNIITPIKFFITDKHFSIKTPQKIKSKVYIPNSQDIKQLKNYFATNEKDFESIFLLSLYGLRQSEIYALTMQDLNTDTNTLTINKAKVKGYQNKYYIKTTKTIESNRQIVITDYLKQLLLEQNYITNKTYRQFYKALKIATTKLNIKYFNPHKLRHYFASEMHRLNIPSKYIQMLGGWATDNILKNVYTHTIETETQKVNQFINQKLF